MLIKNAKTANGKQINVLVENGIISAVFCNETEFCANGHEVIDAQNHTILPGFIDLHCHFRTPGFEYKEDLQTGSLAAAAGGYTYVTCMANTNPVCSNAQIAKEVMQTADKIGLCKVNQCVSITENFDGNTLNHLDDLTDDIIFISDDGKGVQSNKVMFKAMQKARAKNLTVLSHAEDMDVSGEDYRLAENIETVRNLHLAQYTGAKLHMCHVSTKEALCAIIRAKNEGTQVTCEVTPHHIWFYDNDYRVNPPIRQKADVDFIISAIKKGEVDAITTDHAPHTKEEKLKGTPGLVGLETAFGACYKKLCVENGVQLEALSKMMSEKPAKIMGINKGKIEIGYDADFVLVDLSAEYKVDAEKLHSKSKNTPFDGEKLQGKVLMTIKDGKVTFKA